MSKINYSKWDHIEVSDDEDDTHPNIDTGSLFRWRHQARVERMEKEQSEKAHLLSDKMEHKKKVAVLEDRLRSLDTSAESDAEEAQQLGRQLEEIKTKEEEFRKMEEDFVKKERLTPWNVDTLSKPGFEKTIINKPQEKPSEEDDDQKHQRLVSFIDKHEKEIKQFGMLKEHFASRDLLRDHPYLVCSDTASYLTMWCVNLQVEERTSLMERVAHQTIVMQYILELGRQLDRDPRSCVPGFFERLRSADKVYTDAFEDELSSFIGRVKARARARLEEATRQAEEEQQQQRLGPGGLDPVEVMETLPNELKECFDSRDIPRLSEVLGAMPKEVAQYHMERCVKSGLWVPDAKSAGLTPASEELARLQEDSSVPAGCSEEEEEFYDTVADPPEEQGGRGSGTTPADDLGLD